MLSKVKTLSGYKLQARDGEIGSVKEFYFDDRHWTVRYLVAETGSWLTGRKVLVSPYALRGGSKTEKHLTVDLTKEQIEGSPTLDSHKPVSQQFEDEHLGRDGRVLSVMDHCLRNRNYVNVVILCDETMRQQTSEGTPFLELPRLAGILAGIKVDIGTTDPAGHPPRWRAPGPGFDRCAPQ